MPDPRSARRHLDRWAVNQGFADFDTYLQAGGSFLWCRDDLVKRAADIDQCLRYIDNLAGPARRAKAEPADQVPADATIGPAALARLEADHSDDEPGDVANAQIQGLDHA